MNRCFKALLYLFIIICIAYVTYILFIEYYFVKDGHIHYDIYLTHFIQVVSKDNFFMNYGYWDKADTLLQANTSLIDLILAKSGALQKQNIHILDVGCGYGEQDFNWMSLLDLTNKITAVDISDTQIAFVKEKCKTLGLESRLCFDQCDAMLLNKKYAKKSFNTVLSVESAFHYSNRPQFFQSVYDVLEDNGTFVICDIILHNNYTPGLLNRLFLHIFSDFLKIPSCNLIKLKEWETTIKDSGLEIVECIDITDNTFNPYYKNFFHKYMEYYRMPSSFASIIYHFFEYVQPFSYVVAVCKKSVVCN
jgi:cyclopropane fatty-acyl-phospholipid synthase-like methyltransferase